MRIKPTLPTLYLACLSALLAACSSAPKATDAAAPAPAAVPPMAAAAPAPQPAKPATTPVQTAAAAPKALPAYLDPSSDISTKRSVYFDFDRAAIKPEYTSLIDRHGRYLATNPALAIRVEGNTDERGSTEYNLALGQRRAQSVAKALALVGVKDNQMEVVSWGKERPKAAGHSEAVWSQNRRVDLQYPAQ